MRNSTAAQRLEAPTVGGRAVCAEAPRNNATSTAYQSGGALDHDVGRHHRGRTPQRTPAVRLLGTAGLPVPDRSSRSYDDVPRSSIRNLRWLTNRPRPLQPPTQRLHLDQLHGQHPLDIGEVGEIAARTRCGPRRTRAAAKPWPYVRTPRRVRRSPCRGPRPWGLLRLASGVRAIGSGWHRAGGAGACQCGRELARPARTRQFRPIDHWPDPTPSRSGRGPGRHPSDTHDTSPRGAH